MIQYLFLFDWRNTIKMTKNIFKSTIASQLKQARRTAKLTQKSLAEIVGVSIPTIRQAESGKGTYSSFFKIAETLGLEVTGRNIKNTVSLGEALGILRKRQNISIRSLSRLSSLHPNTLKSIEENRAINLHPIDLVANHLQAGLFLKPKDKSLPFWTGIAASSVHDSWETPPELLLKIYPIVNGSFDLDPCSNAVGISANVKAKTHYIREMDGLSLPWNGTVFCNPPYQRGITELWIKKCHTEHKAGRASLIIALLAARPETKAWNSWIKTSADIFLLRKRLRYYENGIKGNHCPFPSAIVVWGGTPAELEDIKKTFLEDWHIKKE